MPARTFALRPEADIKQFLVLKAAAYLLRAFESERGAMHAISIYQVSVAEHPDIAAFYETCGYSGGLTADDAVLVAVRDESLIGAVRLCSEHQVAVLRGMQVLPDFQRQGVGRALLDVCLSRLDDTVCYCISWSYLKQFYNSGGFECCDSTGVPDFLSGRYSCYVQQGRDVIIMRRTIGMNGWYGP